MRRERGPSHGRRCPTIHLLTAVACCLSAHAAVLRPAPGAGADADAWREVVRVAGDALDDTSEGAKLEGGAAGGSRPRVRSFAALGHVLALTCDAGGGGTIDSGGGGSQADDSAAAAADAEDCAAAALFRAVAVHGGPAFPLARRRAAAAAWAAAAASPDATGDAALRVPLAAVYAALQTATGCSDFVRDGLRAAEERALLALLAPGEGGAPPVVALDAAAAARVRDGDVLVADTALAAESVEALAAAAGLRARARALVSPAGLASGAAWRRLLASRAVEGHAAGAPLERLRALGAEAADAWWRAHALVPRAFGVPVDGLPTRAALLAAAPPLPPPVHGGSPPRARPLDALVDAWLYINLDSRPDRRARVEAELRAAGVPAARVIRVGAERHALPAVGCALSHVRALAEIEAHPRWRRVAILEDDFVWRRPPARERGEGATDAGADEGASDAGADGVVPALASRVSRELAAALAAAPDVHVLLLSAAVDNLWTAPAEAVLDEDAGEGGPEPEPGATRPHRLRRVLRAQTSAGYVVAAHYAPTLRAELAAAARSLAASRDETVDALDRRWWALQAAHRWRARLPTPGCQASGFSDVERRHTGYRCPDGAARPPVDMVLTKSERFIFYRKEDIPMCALEYE